LLPASTPCKRTVSDTISSPSRAAFQLSITVLVHYRSERVFSLATSSWLLPTGFLEPRRTTDQKHIWRNTFRLPDYHRLWFHFPEDSTMLSYSYALPLGEERFVHNTIYATAQAHHLCPRSNLRPTRCRDSHKKFRLFRVRSPLLTESCRHLVSQRSLQIIGDKKSAVHFSLFLWVLRCFTSPSSHLTTYEFSRGYVGFTNVGFPIRTFPDHRLLATSPRLIAGCHVLLRLFHAKPSTVRPYVLRPSGITIRMRKSCVADDS
jgi:hypothetical protein